MTTTTGLFDFATHCYVCGPENPEGLHVRFHKDGADGCRAEYVARAEHCGWPGIIHGGLLFTLMDEALGWALVYAGLRGVTARGDFRFAAPATVGMPLVVTGRVVAKRGRIVQAQSEIRDAASNVIAQMSASLYLTDLEQLAPENQA